MDGRPPVMRVLTRPEEKMVERPYITITLPQITMVFALDSDGRELLEAVDVLDGHGTPDWSSASICDTVRGDDPQLQRMVRALLEHITNLVEHPDRNVVWGDHSRFPWNHSTKTPPSERLQHDAIDDELLK